MPDINIDNEMVQAVIKAATCLLVGAVLELIQMDPHQWSKRPCPTCNAVSAIVSTPFGCVKVAHEHQEQIEKLVKRTFECQLLHEY